MTITSTITVPDDAPSTLAADLGYKETDPSAQEAAVKAWIQKVVSSRYTNAKSKAAATTARIAAATDAATITVS